ncbi:ribosome small subunit-dependent GTPase A [Pelistega europaea]|uniref:Small ribosomal subunit biogenesis GTPase RsgA n=1 Tax=Pelistega europaea TaxID=106147 RepID=A0A7Y4LAE2_9BURK|nr:ribosome small subunit-dependent GTPase A [Pelistega europaea]NOL48876.1 ribosome small subunit-dependent GTPase A [Pelistega europaea]
MKGRVITAYGRHFTVQLEDGSIRHSYMKGKKTGVCVGDYVRLALQGAEEARIEEVLPRENLLYRSDEMRSKQFAANVNQLLIVIAVQPTFSDDLLSRALVGAWSAHIQPFILLNKVDLVEDYPAAKERLKDYANLGVPIIETSTLNPEQLRAQLLPILENKTSLLLGQSAMGKSSILNVIVPDAQAHTQEHSVALDAGKHTTTTTSLYALPKIKGAIIDSPGFQSFGLRHLKAAEVVDGFPEFHDYLHLCKFYNCTHLHEPGCGVLQALKEGKISAKRHEMYERILNECMAPEKY